MYIGKLGSLATTSLLAAMLMLSGCVNKKPGEPMQVSSPTSTAPDADETAENKRDPLETVNRGLFRVHEVVDGVLLKPLAHIYRGLMPDAGQDAVRNVLSNAATPVVLLNSVLQWDMVNAERTSERFVVNTTIGIGGIFDVASHIGIPKRHDKDFGQTMGVYGVATGPYVFIPVIGPSDARDVLGMIADVFSDPFTYILTTPENFAYFGVQGLVKRTDLLPTTDMIYRDSLDPYATIRSGYLQHRDNVVRYYKTSDAKDNGEK